MKQHKNYIERNDLKGASHLEVSVYYTKGGANYFCGGTIQRGYYVSVTPVTKKGGTISFELFAGCKRFLFAANRYTDKQFQRAIEMAKDYEDELIAVAVAENKAA